MRNYKLLISAAVLVSTTTIAAVPQVGNMPVPVMSGATVSVHAFYDSTNNVYTYQYTVTNPSSDTGAVTDIFVDMLAPGTYFSPATGIPLTIPYGAQGPIDFNSVLYAVNGREFPHGDTIVTFGATLPNGWMGQITAEGMAAFDTTDDQYAIAPGQSSNAFVMYSPGVPTIKDMQLQPDWVLDAGDGEPTDDEIKQASYVQQAITVHVPTLAPSANFPLTDPQWNDLQNDVNKAIQIGWITDVAWGQSIANKLAAARTTFDSQGPGFIQGALTELQTMVNASTPNQRNQAAFDLLSVNLQAMIAQLPPPGGDPEPQTSPVMSLSIDTPTVAIGGTASFTVHVVDKANNNAPISGADVTVRVFGVNDNEYSGTTDDAGNFNVTYKGTQLGADEVRLQRNSEQLADVGTINWQGGPDLKIKTFIPPVLEWNGNGPIHITESTINVGSTPAGASVTSYYISSSSPFDWNTAEYVGSRDVAILSSGQVDSNGGVDWNLPPDITAGDYTLVACADDHLEVTELDENNNCETTQIAVAMKRDAPAPGPDCSKAAPTVALLWPPNHKMVSVGVTGVTDSTNSALTIAITGIQQDEPVNAAGDGNTAPDGAGVGTSTAQVRSERSGIAQGGRLYFISFKATNTAGGVCTGTVGVGVPHDQGQHSAPVDNGQRYDSTATH